MKKCKLSIIVPVYNIAKWIGECINSLKPLDKNDEIEVIIINDGSTDNSLEVINKNIQNTSFKVITKPNGGLSSARNCGIKNSTGDFLWFVDGDDLIISENINLLLENMNNGNDIIHFKIDKINDQTKEITKDLGWKNKNNKSEMVTKAFLMKNGLEFSPWSKIYRRNVFNDIYWPNVIYEDVFFVSKQLMENKNIYFLNEVLYRYRINRENSILNNANDSVKNKVHIQKLFEFMKDINVNDSYFIAGMYLLTAKMHDLPNEIFTFYKNNLKYVKNTPQFKNYFRRSIIYKFSKIALNMKLFFLLKFFLKRKKVSQ